MKKIETNIAMVLNFIELFGTTYFSVYEKGGKKAEPSIVRHSSSDWHSLANYLHKCDVRHMLFTRAFSGCLAARIYRFVRFSGALVLVFNLDEENCATHIWLFVFGM